MDGLGIDNVSPVDHEGPEALPISQLPPFIGSLERLEIPTNFVSYAFSLPKHLLPRQVKEYEDQVRLWEEWSTLESLAGFQSGVVDATLRILHNTVSWNTLGSHTVAENLYYELIQDINALHGCLISLLRGQETYQEILACRGELAQQLLDLFQDMLDLFPESVGHRDISQALIRLSRAANLLPTCLHLTGLQTVGAQVAAGGSSDIWKGFIGGQSVSVKVMRLFEDTDIEEALRVFGREALIWRQLSHPNLLPFFGVYYLERRLCLVSPWMANGNVLQFLKNAPPDTDRVSLMLDVALGVKYLHENNIAHGDLKGMNILVTPSHRACVTDFGLSYIVDVMTLLFPHTTSSVQGGTARYQAPERLLGCRPRFASDVYAFACVCYEILTQKPPFFEIGGTAADAAIAVKVLTQRLRPSRPEGLPADDALWLLLKDCWSDDPLVRPSILQIIERLLDPQIGATVKLASEDCDRGDAFSSKWRSSIQAQALLPSVTTIERRIFGDDVTEACPKCFPVTSQRSASLGTSGPPAPATTVPVLTPPERRFERYMIPISCILATHYVPVDANDQLCEVFVSTHDLEAARHNLFPPPRLSSTPPRSPNGTPTSAATLPGHQNYSQTLAPSQRVGSDPIDSSRDREDSTIDTPNLEEFLTPSLEEFLTPSLEDFLTPSLESDWDEFTFGDETPRQGCLATPVLEGDDLTEWDPTWSDGALFGGPATYDPVPAEGEVGVGEAGNSSHTGARDEQSGSSLRHSKRLPSEDQFSSFPLKRRREGNPDGDET